MQNLQCRSGGCRAFDDHGLGPFNQTIFTTYASSGLAEGLCLLLNEAMERSAVLQAKPYERGG